MATLLLSYPTASFVPEGATAGETSAYTAHAALGQWLALCDQLTRAGARIMVVDPPKVVAGPAPVADAGSASTVYAARLGAAFLSPGKLNRPSFLRARGAAPPLSPTEDTVSQAIAGAGLEVRLGQAQFQGQPDIIALDRNRFVLTYSSAPMASSKASLDEVKALLPMGAQTLDIELAAPFTAGAQALCFLTGPSGSKVMLIHRAALLSHTPEDIARFIGNKIETFIVAADDIAVHACECIALRGTLVLQEGSSTILRGQLARRGFQIVQTDVSQLFGPGGGGPRMLVNELSGMVLSDDAPSYSSRRDELQQLLATYHR